MESFAAVYKQSKKILSLLKSHSLSQTAVNTQHMLYQCGDKSISSGEASTLPVAGPGSYFEGTEDAYFLTPWGNIYPPRPPSVRAVTPLLSRGIIYPMERGAKDSIV